VTVVEVRLAGIVERCFALIQPEEKTEKKKIRGKAENRK
jgi:hypothetical protein